jgi:hypothetical protein
LTKYLVALVVEPHRRQPDAAVRSDQAEGHGDRPVEQRLVDRIEIRQALDLDVIAHGELSGLQAVGDIPEFRDSDAGCHVPS